MRQTLIRIRLDELWLFGPVDDTTAVGGGYFLLAWVAYGLWWWFRHAGSPAAKRFNPFVIGITAVILSGPLWAARAIPNGMPIYGYGFMLFLGLLMAGWSAARRACRVGLSGKGATKDVEIIWDLAVWIFFAGIVGARLFYVVQYHERVFGGNAGGEQVQAAVNLPDGGLVFYGGMIMATLAYAVFCYVKQIKALLLADVIVPAAFIGLAFGRLGCFLNGCCYGDRCELPWAVTFPHESVPFVALVNRGFLDPQAAVSLALHPTQIYSALNAIVLAFLTGAYFKYRYRDGAVLALGMIAYPVTRFVIEFLRGDELGQFNTAFTISQWVSMGLFSAGLLFLIWLTTRHSIPSMRPKSSG